MRDVGSRTVRELTFPSASRLVCGEATSQTERSVASAISVAGSLQILPRLAKPPVISSDFQSSR
jgi:hypothetical protein